MITEISGIQVGNWIVKYVYFVIELVNLVSISWIHLYQIDLASKKEFQNVSIIRLQLGIKDHSQVFKQDV